MSDVWDMRLGLVRLLDALNDPELEQDREADLLEVESLLAQASLRGRPVAAYRDLATSF